ncbi:MAG: DUF1989 domain-containing protein [Sneathiella sp.]
MKYHPQTNPPADANVRRSVPPVVCYPIATLPRPVMDIYSQARESLILQEKITIPPRDAKTFAVPAGHFFRITCPDGPQVGDLNLWSADNLDERFFSGKTRALHGTHVSTGDQLWSNLPHMRPMATLTHDTLDWYGWDEFGGSVHDVIGTRCDPYTNAVLGSDDYHYCCHSNLTRALAADRNISLVQAEPFVHDVLNVFMCTGFTQDTHQYFMKASPVRKGDYLEFFAEIDLLGALSTCPGGDCSSSHSSEAASCFALDVEIYKCGSDHLTNWRSPPKSSYPGTHGLK